MTPTKNIVITIEHTAPVLYFKPGYKVVILNSDGVRWDIPGANFRSDELSKAKEYGLAMSNFFCCDFVTIENDQNKTEEKTPVVTKEHGEKYERSKAEKMYDYGGDF